MAEENNVKKITAQFTVEMTVDKDSSVDIEEALTSCENCQADLDEALDRLVKLENNIVVLKSVGVDVDEIRETIASDQSRSKRGMLAGARRIFRHGNIDVVEVVRLSDEDL